MAEFIIRKAVPKDARGIVEAHHAAVREKAHGDYDAAILEAWSPSITRERVVRMEAKLADDKIYTVVAESEGRILGFGQMRAAENLLGAVYVRKNPCGRVGEGIVRHLIGQARAEKAEYLAMDASLNSEAFYTRLGFRSLGHGVHKLKAGGEMACVKMRLDLA